jgi:hypothetical protein
MFCTQFKGNTLNSFGYWRIKFIVKTLSITSLRFNSRFMHLLLISDHAYLFWYIYIYIYIYISSPPVNKILSEYEGDSTLVNLTRPRSRFRCTCGILIRNVLRKWSVSYLNDHSTCHYVVTVVLIIIVF